MDALAQGLSSWTIDNLRCERLSSATKHYLPRQKIKADKDSDESGTENEHQRREAAGEPAGH